MPKLDRLIQTITDDLDVPTIFEDWTVGQWREVAGRTLVVSHEPETAMDEYLCAVDDEAEFDVDAYLAENPSKWIQFIPLFEAGELAPPPIQKDK